jgi:sulfotransferase family protein
MKINLISGPRNISTALMYSFAQRPDTTVVDEPFYAYYLKNSNAEHPGREETIKSMPSSLEEVVRKWIDEPHKKEHLFIKNMAQHLIKMDLNFLYKVTNLFLIRDPEKLIPSFSKVIPRPVMQDIGLEHEWFLFKLIKENTRKTPIVLDSDEVLKDPEKVLKQVCKELGISFYKEMLSWKPGPRSEDGVWAKYWYENVHKSSGFQAPSNNDTIFPEHCIELLKEAKPFYNQLLKYSIHI